MSKLIKTENPLWNDIFKPVTVLFVICAVIAAALGLANAVTADRIEALAAKRRLEAMQKLFVGTDFEEEDAGEYTYSRALDGGEVIGYVFTTSAKGYGGDVSVMTAVNPDGTVKAVSILDVSNETPGLGQNAAREDFYGQLSGLSGKISLNKISADPELNEITPVTGATITSTAVKDAVNEALACFAQIGQDAAQEEVSSYAE